MRVGPQLAVWHLGNLLSINMCPESSLKMLTVLLKQHLIGIFLVSASATLYPWCHRPETAVNWWHLLNCSLYLRLCLLICMCTFALVVDVLLFSFVPSAFMCRSTGAIFIPVVFMFIPYWTVWGRNCRTNTMRTAVRSWWTFVAAEISWK